MWKAPVRFRVEKRAWKTCLRSLPIVWTSHCCCCVISGSLCQAADVHKFQQAPHQVPLVVPKPLVEEHSTRVLSTGFATLFSKCPQIFCCSRNVKCSPVHLCKFKFMSFTLILSNLCHLSVWKLQTCPSVDFGIRSGFRNQTSSDILNFFKRWDCILTVHLNFLVYLLQLQYTILYGGPTVFSRDCQSQ